MSNYHEILSLLILFVVYLMTPEFQCMLKSWMIVSNDFRGVQKKWQWLKLKYFPDKLRKPTKKLTFITDSVGRVSNRTPTNYRRKGFFLSHLAR
jgi:hypothetical protein